MSARPRSARASRARRLISLLGGLLIAVSVLLPAGRATAAVKYVPLNGDGSSWAEPAIDQFGRNIYSQGVVVNFSGDGSAAGRGHYIEDQNDFAATDIQFLTQPDPFGSQSEHSAYSYSYIPIVAGGTTFMYNLTVGRTKITNLRLSGDTIAKIFTGQITNWDDPLITRDYGRQLPSQRITVVTRSDGSGASYQFTRYLATDFNNEWHPFCVKEGGTGACGPTEFYPGFANSVQRNGSDQVADFLASSTGEGSIGYDEYSYALTNNIPVVKLLNSAGYYTLPSASNVAIALQAAQIDENPSSPTYLIQNLDNVYTNRDPRTYPLSSYSYLIVPRTARPNEPVLPRYDPTQGGSLAKGDTLKTFLNYVVCGAQQQAASLGYSPLPVNLVQGAIRQDQYIPQTGAVPAININNLNNCNNPTYHNGVNYLIKDAPQPSKCDFHTAPLNCGSGASGLGNANTTPASGSGTRSGASTGSASGTGGAGSGAAASTGRTAATGSAGSGAIDPVTGQAAGSTTDAADGTQPVANAVPLAGAHGADGIYATLVALALLAAVLVPAGLGMALRRRPRP